MKTILSTLTLPHAQQFLHIYLHRYELTRSALVTSLLGPRSSIPILTPLLRVLALSLTYITGAAEADSDAVSEALSGPGSTKKAMDALSQSARITLIAAKAIENMAMQQQIKFVQTLIDRDKLAQQILMSAGAIGDNREYIASPELIVDLCYNARSAGPDDSELIAVRVIRGWLSVADAMVQESRLGKAVVGVGLDGVSISAAATVMHATRLLELLLQVVKTNDRSVVDPSTLVAATFVQASCNGLRSVAATVRGLSVAAHAALLQRLCTVAGHSWIRQAIMGRIAQAYDDALEQVEKRDYAISAWTMWPECLADGIIDVDYDGILVEPLARQVQSETSSMHDYVLYPELSFATGFDPGIINSLIEDIWAVLGACDLAQSLALDASRNGVGVISLGGAAVPLSLPSRDDIRSLHTLPRTATGLPLVSPWDVRSFVLPSDRCFRLLGLDRWRYYTAAHLTDTSTTTSPYVPCFITQGAQTAGFRLVPQVLPLFEVYDEHEVPRVPCLDTLSKLWNTTVAELQRNIAVLSPQANNPTLRSWADALRFVGMLCVAPVDPSGVVGAGRAITPSTGHYYHADPQVLLRVPFSSHDAAADSCFGKPLVIGPLRGGGAALVLYPFLSIPSSACVDTIDKHLIALPLIAVRDGEAPLRWIQRGEAEPPRPTMLRILGWTFPVQEVADIVLLPMPNLSDDYAELQGSDDFRPTHVSKVNMIVSLLQEGDPTESQLATDPSPHAAEATLPVYLSTTLE